MDLNFGPGSYPQLVLHVPEEEDLRLLVESLEKLVPLGLEVEQSVIRDKLGLPDPATGAEVKLLGAPAAAPAAVPAAPAVNAQALNREQVATPDREDQLAALLADAADPLVSDWIDQVRELVDGAGSLEELRDGLLDLLPTMDAGKFADVMQHALAVAGAAGMLDALDDSRA